MDNLQLKISSSGFKATYQTISFLLKVEPGGTKPGAGSIPSFNKDLGNIKLVTDSKQLPDVIITSVSLSVRLNADKKIFNIEKI